MTCETDQDCGAARCLCGVCTSECEADSQCNAPDEGDAVCIAPGMRGISSDCAGAGTGTGTGSTQPETSAAVCLVACGDDVDCDRGLRCLQGACIDATALSEVGVLDGPCEPTGGCESGLGCDGDAVCALLGDGTEPPDPECADNGDCTAGRMCDDGMCLSPPANQVEDGCSSSAACDSGYVCERRTCVLAWSGAGCNAAAQDRPTCGSGGACSEGLLCHIDGTCIEPGKCDSGGDTVLATVGQMKLVALSETHLYMAALETRDGLNNPQGDGRLARMALGGGSVETIADNLGDWSQVNLRGDNIFYQEGDGIYAVPADGSAAPALMVANARYGWAVEGDFVYYVAASSLEEEGELTRFDRIQITTDTIAPTIHLWGELHLDSDAFYLSYDGHGATRIPREGGDEVEIDEGLDNRLLMGPKRLYFQAGPDPYLIYSTDMHGDDEKTLANDDQLDNDGGGAGLRLYRDHIYWQLSGSGKLHRTPTTPGDSTIVTDTLALRQEGWTTSDASTGTFVVGDAGIFWVSAGQLVRRVLPEFALADAAQGSPGGPCFGNLRCSAPNSCTNRRCQAP